MTPPDDSMAAAAMAEHSLNEAGLSSGTTSDLSRQPALVAIYHTHNAETYIPYQGQAKVEGQNGGVSLVGNEMVKVLAQQGIRDGARPDHSRLPGLSLLLYQVGAHRQAAGAAESGAESPARRASGCRTAGEGDRACGQRGFGPDHDRGGERSASACPTRNWRENYAFAQEVAHRLQEQYPGVLKQVLIDGRYNQHVFSARHPGGGRERKEHPRRGAGGSTLFCHGSGRGDPEIGSAFTEPITHFRNLRKNNRQTLLDLAV